MTEPEVSIGIVNAPVIEFVLEGMYYDKNYDEYPAGKYKAYYEDLYVVILTPKLHRYKSEDFNLRPANYDRCSLTIKDVVIGIQFHWQRKEDQRFRGALRFISGNKSIEAINIIPVEDYLHSVISSEMSASSSLELLKAHAIISRSWVLAQMEKRLKLNSKASVAHSFETDDEIIRWYDSESHTAYDVCADDHCQRYQGITKVITPKAAQAIDATAGMVLTYKGNICDARFYKACGGFTENFENVWEPQQVPYLRSIRDFSTCEHEQEWDLTNEMQFNEWIDSDFPAFCETDDHEVLSQALLDYDKETTDFYRWRVTYSQAEITELIHKKSGIDFGNIIDLIPLERGKSGRLIKLKIIGTKKSITFGKELEIRKWLSKSHLYSAAFRVEKAMASNGLPASFTLIGAGWGHGVGLCQIGAAVMASKSYTFDAILQHYFVNSDISVLYEREDQ